MIIDKKYVIFISLFVKLSKVNHLLVEYILFLTALPTSK